MLTSEFTSVCGPGPRINEHILWHCLMACAGKDHTPFIGLLTRDYAGDPLWHLLD